MGEKDIKKIRCPLCGEGEIEAPFDFKKIDIKMQQKSKIAKMLKKEGFSFRQIMRLFGYNSVSSVQYLLNYNFNTGVDKR